MQSMHITTNVVSLNPTQCEVCSVQHYLIKFVSDLWHVGGFLLVLRLPTPIKLTDHHDINVILLKVALNTIPLTLTLYITLRITEYKNRISLHKRVCIHFTIYTRIPFIINVRNNILVTGSF